MRSHVPALLGRASRPLVFLGLFGIALSALCVVVAVARGLAIPPEGDLSKPITFDAAVGLYVVTLGFILPLARFSAAGERRWAGITCGLMLYAYGIETIQQFRGIDPRFSHAGGPVDGLAATVFGADAGGIILMFVILAVVLARRGTRGANGLVLLGLHYASSATMIAFSAGIWMIAIQGRHTGAAGNIPPLHALGFHSLQAIPLIAWLFSRSPIPEREARRWVHAAGVAWIAACLGIAWQTAAGRPVTELSPAMLVALLFLLGWLLSAVRAVLAWRTPRPAAAASPAA